MSDPTPTKPKRRRFNPFRYAFSIFKRYFILFLLLLILVGSLNLLLNQKYYQTKLTRKIYEKAQIKIDFDELYLNLFTGNIEGGDLQVHFAKTGMHLGLTQFKVRINPLHLFLAQINLKSIEADKIFVDLSQLNRPAAEPSAEKKQIPNFLEHIDLSHAKINQLFINRGLKGYFTLEDFQLTTAYTGFLTNSPLLSSVKNIRSVTPKFAVFVNDVELKGDFALDLSSDNLLKTSDLAATITLTNLLLAIEKKPKPWLSNPSWDSDLEETLKDYYTETIPLHKSFLFAKSIQFETKIKEQVLSVKDFEFNLNDSLLTGDAHWDKNSGDFELKIKTESDLPVSKFPLGQAQFRKAFTGLGVDLNMSGKATSFEEHRLKFNLKATASGNLAHPEAGPIHASMTGKIDNRVLSSDDILFKLADGQIGASGSVNLQTLAANVRYSAHNFDLETLIRFFSTIRIPSLADGDGTITGSLKNPRIEAKVTAANAAYEFLNFGPAAARLLLENKNLKLDVDSQNNDTGKSQMVLTIKNVFESGDQTVELKAQFDSLKIQNALATQNLEGLVSGNFDFKRVQNKNAGGGKATATHVKILGRDYGTVTTSYTLKEKHVDLRPIQLQLFEPAILTASDKGLQFDFDDKGFTFSGYPLPDLFVKGAVLKSQKEILQIQGEAKNLSVFFLRPFLSLDIIKSQVSVKFQSRYHIYEPLASEFEGKFTDLQLSMPEGVISLAAPATLTYKNKILGFQKFRLKHGRGDVMLDGSLGLENSTNLKIAGQIDFNPWADLNPFLSFVEKPIEVDLTLKGETLQPGIFGTVKFADDSLQLRQLPGDFENMTGVLRLDGTKITTDGLQLLYNDAPVNLKGFVKTNYEIVTQADLQIYGNEVPFHMDNGMDFLADLNLTLKGDSNLNVAGTLRIVEGQYTRNYGITNFIIKPQELESSRPTDETRWAMLPVSTNLNISVSNTGDFLVNNNLAYLELNVNLDLLGTIKTPMLNGQVDFLNGKIHAFGVYFEEATGYAQFYKGPVINPVINLKATTEIQNYSIIANATGTLENFKLLLDSNPTLDRKDIISLLFYGQTSDQIVGTASNTFLQTAAITQLASVLAHPLSRVSGLDFFNISQRQETSQESIQRIAIGKSLSNRLNLAFTADVGNDDPERAIELDFQVFDAFFLDVAKDFGNRYRFDLNLRFEAY